MNKIIVIILLALLFVPVSSAALVNPGESIQAAINDAAAGDTIQVTSGTYHENVVVNKTLTLQGDGATVKALTHSEHAFSVTADHVNISGFTATNATGYRKAGIFVSGGYCNITGNMVSDNKYGIYIFGSDHNTITGNTANGNKRYGIYLLISYHNTITGNTANENEWYGIYLSRSDHNILVGNTANENECYIGIYIHDSNDINLIENVVCRNGWEGMRIAQSSNYIIDENIACGNNLTNVSTGILLWESPNALLINNSVDNNTFGIYVHIGCPNTVVSNNTVHDSDYVGITAYNTSDAEIHNNTVDNSDGFGIFVVEMLSENISIIGNTITNSTAHGIYCVPYYTGTGPTHITISENVISGNVAGIRLNCTNHTTISGNLLEGNYEGVNLTSTEDIDIFNNYFDNYHNSYDDSNNIWNATITTGPNIVGGQAIGGNYWMDYSGIDSNRDGFGEVAYDIPGGSNQDLLPLVKQTMVCGDVDTNGYISANDVVETYRRAVDPDYPLMSEWAADADGNGYISANDVVEIYRAAVDPNHGLHCTITAPRNIHEHNKHINNSADSIARFGDSISSRRRTINVDGE